MILHNVREMRMRKILILAALGVMGVMPLSWAQETDVAPTINETFKNADLNVDNYVASFSSESREAFAARADVTKALGLKPGEAIAEVGAGTGVYTRLFAQAVGPAGKVYAVDIAPKFLAYIAANMAKEGFKNLQTVQGSDRSTNLPTASVDVTFSSDVYHHFEYPMTMNADIRRALKPNGRLYVLEMEKAGRQATHVRAPKNVVIAEIEKSGFKLVDDIKVPGLRESYLLHFRKS
jgi:ubiquinone/menaquinone biosynthesis C-methylase UbiE